MGRRRKKSSVNTKTSGSSDNAAVYASSYQPKKKVETEWSIDLIKSLEWKRFEELCSGYFNEKGFRSEITRLGADGGIDIYLYRDSFSLTSPMSIVQCKAWNTYKVGVKPIRELFGVMHAAKVPTGVFVTSGEYTKAALKSGQDNNLKLFTESLLLKEILKLPDDNQKRLLKDITEGDYTTPSCPYQGIKMKLRKNKKDGNQFWGCPEFPKCRSTLKFKTS